MSVSVPLHFDTQHDDEGLSRYGDEDHNHLTTSIIDSVYIRMFLTRIPFGFREQSREVRLSLANNLTITLGDMSPTGIGGKKLDSRIGVVQETCIAAYIA
jgi:hypothetical protein